MPLTEAQQTAVTARNRELLVSAAAGSGKTRVLIERILSLLRDDHLSLKRMLIVTFTRAAAAEMRDRLTARLTEEAERDPLLRRQRDLTDTAEIGTLHSFCQRLVREYFQAVEIDPQAALCDEVVRANLFQQAIDETLEEGYALAQNDPELRSLTHKFTDMELDQMLHQLYAFLLSQPEPFEWLRAQAAHVYTPEDLRSGPMAETLLSDARILLSGAQALCDDLRALSEEPACREEYRASIRLDIAAVLPLTEAVGRDLPALMAETRRFALGRLPSLRKLEPDETDARDRYKALRERLKKLVEELSGLLPADEQSCIDDLERMQPALRGLSKLVEMLHERFQASKSDRALIDFGDLEHMALRILRDPALRKEIAGRYDAVFVDEYQDVSALQEALLSALHRTDAPDVPRETLLPEYAPLDVPRETSAADGSAPAGGTPYTREELERERQALITAAGERPEPKNETSFFYVGDVKQSIYRFRQADPTLFLDKLRSFSREADAFQRKLTLNRNFRSRENVLESVNRVFSHVMRADVTELAYDDDARLYAGAPSLDDPPTTLHIYAEAGLRSADRPRLEALEIAKEIQRRVGQPLTDAQGHTKGVLHYRDFAVLLPVARGVSEVVERTLAEKGVPVYCEDGKAGMESEEITQTLQHLKLMDNLADDLSLLAALRGPVYEFDERELAGVRLCRPEREISFLEAMQAAAEGDDALAERCRVTLAQLERERVLMHSLPLDEYLWDWLSRSGLYGYYGAQPGGRLRQANLRMLCEKASEHVRVRGGNLHSFLGTVTATGGVRDGTSPTVLSPWEDVVRVMTIHKSKGLEFPVVFVMGLGDRLHKGTSAGLLSCHPKLGVALRYVNEEARTKRSTLLGGAIALRTRAEEKAERARVLYVAMTRARDEVVLLGGGAGLTLTPKSYPQSATDASYELWQAKSLLEWLTQCVRTDDELTVSDPSTFSMPARGKTDPDAAFCTKHTCFPQSFHPWRVFFHNEPLDPALRTRAEQRQPLDRQAVREARLSALLERAQAPDAGKPQPTTTGMPDDPSIASAVARSSNDATLDPETADPIAPPLRFTHAPFKLGVTAICRAGRFEQAPDEADDEIADKRLPLPLSRPKLMADLPRLPAFMRPPQKQTGVQRGVATHKALCLLPLEPLRSAPNAAARAAVIRSELSDMARDHRLSKEEAPLADARAIAGFFESEWGQAALRAETVRREWGFNLSLPGLETLAQGVIDLCYLENGAWQLVDYKTDRVETADELWTLYGPQVEMYRRALSVGTPYPVGRVTLYSLSLQQGSARE